MKRAACWSISILIVVLVALAAVRTVNARKDWSNYRVSQNVTDRMVALFDGLGTKKDELTFGGVTSAVAVGAAGYGDAMVFDLPNGEGQMGIHRLQDRDRVVVRF